MVMVAEIFKMMLLHNYIKITDVSIAIVKINYASS